MKNINTKIVCILFAIIYAVDGIIAVQWHGTLAAVGWGSASLLALLGSYIFSTPLFYLLKSNIFSKILLIIAMVIGTFAYWVVSSLGFFGGLSWIVTTTLIAAASILVANNTDN